MKAAAEAGVAPRVWHTNIEDKISVTDFVEAEPLPVSEALVRLPALLLTLHSLTPFGRAPFNTSCTFLIDKGPALDGFLQKFQAANILPKAECEEFFARYADLAVVANQIVTNDEEEVVYLQEYFGAAPDQYQLARFHLMQQIAHLFYTMAFLFLGSSGKPIDWRGTVPEFRDYQRRIWAGEVDMTDKDVKIAYGRVHWERLLQNVRQTRYNEALRIVSGRHSAEIFRAAYLRSGRGRVQVSALVRRSGENLPGLGEPC